MAGAPRQSQIFGLGDLHWPRVRNLSAIVCGGLGILFTTGWVAIVENIREFLIGMSLPVPGWLPHAEATAWPPPVRAVTMASMATIFVWGLWPERKSLKASKRGARYLVLFIGWLVAFGLAEATFRPAAPSPAKLMSRAATPAKSQATFEHTREGRTHYTPKPKHTDRYRFTVPLKRFAAEGLDLETRLQVVSEASEPIGEEKMWNWIDRTGEWICDNMGSYALRKFSDTSKMDARRQVVAQTPKARGAILIMGTLNENLQDLIDKNTWDPDGDPTPPVQGCRAAIGIPSELATSPLETH